MNILPENLNLALFFIVISLMPEVTFNNNLNQIFQLPHTYVCLYTLIYTLYLFWMCFLCNFCHLDRSGLMYESPLSYLLMDHCIGNVQTRTQFKSLCNVREPFSILKNKQSPSIHIYIYTLCIILDKVPGTPSTPSTPGNRVQFPMQ